MGVIDDAEIDKRFDHHAPSDERVKVHELVRADFKELAIALADTLPEGREKSLAFTALEESSFWAQAAIARQGSE